MKLRVVKDEGAEQGPPWGMHDGEAAHDVGGAGILREAVGGDIARLGIDHAEVVGDGSGLDEFFQRAFQQLCAPVIGQGGVGRDGVLYPCPGGGIGKPSIHGVAEDGAVEVIALDIKDGADIEDGACLGGAADHVAWMIRHGINVLDGAEVGGRAEGGEIDVAGG